MLIVCLETDFTRLSENGMREAVQIARKILEEESNRERNEMLAAMNAAVEQMEMRDGVNPGTYKRFE